MNLKAYRTGVRTGLPVGMGYFSVSFGFGAMAAAQGVKTVHAVLISLTNLTSAGQFAGLTLILAGTTPGEAATACGYKNYASFYKVFLKFTGQSPSALSFAKKEM